MDLVSAYLENKPITDFVDLNNYPLLNNPVYRTILTDSIIRAFSEVQVPNLRLNATDYSLKMINQTDVAIYHHGD